MKKLAFVFPGQGAQYIGMGKEFIEKDLESKQIFEKANNLLDFNLNEICFTENEKIHITAYTQPALLTVCIAILEAVKKTGVKASCVAGLSLGEYTALVANGALDFETAIDLVRKRGIYMEEAAINTKGTMAAVIGSNKEIIKNICDETEGYVDIANYNSPKQIVISGEIDAVNRVMNKLNELKIKVIPLKVSGAFHSNLMEEAAEKLEKYLSEVAFNDFTIPYYSNVTGQKVTDKTNIKTLLTRQVQESVRWEDNVKAMIEDGVDTFVEIGPSKTLAGLIKKIDRSKKVINIEDYEGLNHLKMYLEEI
jgi:[acyl-carrier-protein] S-malonyltransferase